MIKKPRKLVVMVISCVLLSQTIPFMTLNWQNLDGWFNQDHGILYLDSIPYFAKGMHFLLLYLLLL